MLDFLKASGLSVRVIGVTAIGAGCAVYSVTAWLGIPQTTGLWTIFALVIGGLSLVIAKVWGHFFGEKSKGSAP